MALSGAIFILPFFLFSATAGQLADKLAKPTLVRWIKLAEIGIMVARRRRLHDRHALAAARRAVPDGPALERSSAR